MFGWDDAAMLAMAYFASEGQEDTNRANSAQSQAQMDFQERMSNTAYQRATTDMKAAGLNPMLAYSQGGATTPGGAQSTMGNSAAAGVAAAQAQMQRTLTESQVDKTKAETELIRSQVPLSEYTIAELKQRVLNGQASAAQVAELTKRLKDENSEGIGFSAAAYEKQRAAGEGWRQHMDYDKYKHGYGESVVTNLNARTRQATASALLDELEGPHARAEAGYWNDVGKGGAYADHGTGLVGRLASSASSVGLRLPRKYNDLVVRGQNGTVSRSGRR